MKIQGLGEDLETKHSWYRGEGPAVFPNAEQIGPDSCFVDGDSITRAKGNADMREGFLNACFTPAVALDPLWEMASSYDICALQYFYATLLKWSSELNNTRMTTAFQMLLGNAVTTNWIPGVSPLPNVMIAVMPTFSVVVVDGTADFQTLAMQAFSTIEPPQNFGIISTYFLWYNTSTYVNDLCGTVGVDKDAPLMLVGYSYGAAVIDILAARYNVANPARKIRTLTFGAPKPGDLRLQLYLQETFGLSIANEEDIVCSLPPNLIITWPVAIALSLPELIVWDQWVREPNRARQAIDGSLTYNVDPIIDTPLLTHLVEQILGLQPFDPVLPHRITEYRRRIGVRCTQTQWPISVPLWIYLHELDFVAQAGLRIGATVNDYTPLLCECCGGIPMPGSYGMKVTAPDYPEIDGQVIEMVSDGSTPECQWNGTLDIGGTTVTALALSWHADLGFPYAINIEWADSPYGNWFWGQILPREEFACTPFWFDASGLVSIDGVETDKVARVTVDGSAERIRVGLSIGANIDSTPPETPFNVGLRIGARLVTIGPTEDFNVGFKIGSQVLPPQQKPAFKIGATVADS